MSKVQRPLSEILAELESIISGRKITAIQLEHNVGINYFAARRIIKGQTKNRTKSLELVCTFFGISLNEDGKMQSAVGMTMIDTLDQVWDGSNAHAQLIINLIKGTSSFRIERSSSPPTRGSL